MNKDAIMATIIGFGIGLAITGAILIGPNALKYFPSIKLPTMSINVKPTSALGEPSPTPLPSSFSLDSPLPEAIVDSESVLVSGSAQPGSVIVIEGVDDEVVSTATNDGKFAGKITLVEGKNIISVTNYHDTDVQSVSVTVYYTQESF